MIWKDIIEIEILKHKHRKIQDTSRRKVDGFIKTIYYIPLLPIKDVTLREKVRIDLTENSIEIIL